VAVCGGGHGALAIAGALSLGGFVVRLALRNRQRFDRLFATRRLRMEGALEGEVEIAEVTDDHAAAVAGADLVVVPLPAPAQLAVVERIAPAIREGQVLLITKGTFSAFPAAEALRHADVPPIPVAENAILPFGARASGPASVRIGLVATHLPTGVYPAVRTEEALGAIRQAFPATEPAQDALDATLLNFDPALHAPLVLMNAGPIENRPDFDVHVEGNPPSVVTVSVALDAERIALREALGYSGPHWPLADLYSRVGETYFGVLGRERQTETSVWREKLDFRHRYIEEDVAGGLALWASLGRRLGVPTPLAEAFLLLASTVNDEEYLRTGRTLENLGLGGIGLETLRAWLRTGRGM
jgi:opine dehydrogenase